MDKFDISIVTPSYNMLALLPMNVRSVADQEGVSVEHWIIDGGSTDGTVDWLSREYACKFISERDNGMYDALNKGFSMASAQIVGHLNCDEQYLPGTLRKVFDFFKENPDVDFVVGNFLVVDSKGGFLAYRKAFKPRWVYFFSNYLYAVTCTTFYRKKVLDEMKFDVGYKSISDMDFMYRVLKKGYRSRHLNFYASTFADTGENLSLQASATAERERILQGLPLWYRLLMPVFRYVFYIERFLRGAFARDKYIEYSIYRRPEDVTRTLAKVDRPTFRWAFGKVSK